MAPKVDFKLQDKVKKYLESNSPQKFPASDIAAWILRKYPSECQKKKDASTTISDDDDLIKAITKEIAAYRPRLQKNYWQIKTTGNRPRLYFWKTQIDTDGTEKSEKLSARESDLYPVLCEYLGAREPKIYSLRIDEKVSSNTKGPKGNKWLYPDIVGMENLQHDWTREVREAAEKYSSKRARLWSFEVKSKLTRSNVREAFFQTVSNSSWANFSYLVVSCQQVVHSAPIGDADVSKQPSTQEGRMNTHKNARLTPHSRAVLVRRVLEDGQTPKAAAAAFGVCPKTAAKWVARFQAEGAAGLRNRSSRPHQLRQPTPAYVLHRIEALRRQRWNGQQIAARLGISASTVSRTLRRLRLNRIRDLDPPLPPPNRYERDEPGELLHLDIKKLGRFKAPGHRITGCHPGMHRSVGAGWESLHVCVDDHSRIAFCAVMPDETARSAIAFLQAALAYYQSLGVSVKCVMTDNGACYRSKLFRRLCAEWGLRQIRTRPYTPRTNGKAERFIQTALREWAYAVTYQTSAQRCDQLPAWVHRYNWHRRHRSLKGHPPISRLGLDMDNLLRSHT